MARREVGASLSWTQNIGGQIGGAGNVCQKEAHRSASGGAPPGVAMWPGYLHDAKPRVHGLHKPRKGDSRDVYRALATPAEGGGKPYWLSEKCCRGWSARHLR